MLGPIQQSRPPTGSQFVLALQHVGNYQEAHSEPSDPSHVHDDIVNQFFEEYRLNWGVSENELLQVSFRTQWVMPILDAPSPSSPTSGGSSTGSISSASAGLANSNAHHSSQASNMLYHHSPSQHPGHYHHHNGAVSSLTPPAHSLLPPVSLSQSMNMNRSSTAGYTHHADHASMSSGVSAAESGSQNSTNFDRTAHFSLSAIGSSAMGPYVDRMSVGGGSSAVSEERSTASNGGGASSSLSSSASSPWMASPRLG